MWHSICTRFSVLGAWYSMLRCKMKKNKQKNERYRWIFIPIYLYVYFITPIYAFMDLLIKIWIKILQHKKLVCHPVLRLSVLGAHWEPGMILNLRDIHSDGIQLRVLMHHRELKTCSNPLEKHWNFYSTPVSTIIPGSWNNNNNFHFG